MLKILLKDYYNGIQKKEYQVLVSIILSNLEALLHPWLYEAINKSYNQIRSKDDIDLY